MRSDISEAIGALAAENFAVYGFEAWLVNGNGTWTGLLPEEGTSIPAVVAGNVVDWGDGEAVEVYAHRVTEYVNSELDRIAIDKTLVPGALSRLRYHLTIGSRPTPNQSTDPTLASGTPGAGHQPRHP